MIKTSKEMFNDEFYTLREHIEPLVKYLNSKNIKNIWCPVDTVDSEFVKVFKENGFKVYNTHINKGQNFLEYKPKFKFDIIITNPPYTIKQEWLNKCLDHKKPFILLLPSTSLMWKVTKLNAEKIKIIWFEKRINFITPTGDLKSPADTIYLTYDLLNSNKLMKEGK